MTKLALSTLGALGPAVAVPQYERSALRPGIVHVGVGNFHRAHQALYLDDLFNAGRDHAWGLVGAGVRATDAAMRARLAAQDWLSTVVELEPGANTARVTGAKIDFVEVDPTNRPLIAAMADPRIRIVSLTVTEGGYYLDAASHFDPTHPEIVADAKAPRAPRTVFGAMIRALRQRRGAGTPPFTIMSCDNLPSNGHVTRAAVVGLARLSDPNLADWIEDNVAFPNGMVDRITPAATDAHRQQLRDRFGIEDEAPVVCEPFRQWVLEDNFPLGRPAFEEVGVTFTDAIEAFELMKLRVLNGGHALIAYAAALLDIEYAHDAMDDPLVAGFMDKVERDEILPVVPRVPGTSLELYLDTIKERFANPDVGDTIARLCLDGSNRQPKFILPSTRDRLAQGLSATGLALASALWCRYLHGETETGAPIKIDDVNGASLRAAAKRARTEPQAFLDALPGIFGDLTDAAPFQTAFAQALGRLWRDGTARTLERYLALPPGATLGV